MASTFPTTLNNWIAGDTIEFAWAKELEKKIGINSSLVATSHDYLLRHLPAQESDLAMGTHKITGVVDPTSDQHASTKKYVDDEITGLSSSYAPLASPTFTGTVTLPRTNINEYVNITETVAGALKTQVRHINSSNTVGTGGRLSFRMLDSNSAIQTYGRISTEIDTNTAGSEDGTMRLSVIGGGVFDDLLILDGSSKSATFAGAIAGSNLSGTNTGDNTVCTSGTATTAATLATSRNINGVAFDGSANITVTADASTLSGVTLKSTVLASSLTSVGTLANLTVTNTITGSISGQAGTVATIAGLAPNTATTQATQGAITSLGTLTGLTMGGNIVMADNSITGIDTLTFTDINGTIAGVQNQFLSTNLPSDENLVGYWSLDEQTGSIATDGSGNGNDGTLHNMEEADWIAGVVGTALDFDGANERVEVTNTGITTPQEMSISAWFKRNADDTIGGIAGFTSEAFSIYITGNTTIRLNARRSDDGGDLSGRFGASVPALGTTWHHCVITQTTDYTVKPKLYLDGVEYIVGSPQVYGVAVNDDFVIGEMNIGGGICFAGKVDEVKLYTSALTAKEIYALYKNPAGTKTFDQNLNTGNSPKFAGLDITGNNITIATAQSPASNASGIVGEIAWDASYIYVCTASGVWKRIALTGGY